MTASRPRVLRRSKRELAWSTEVSDWAHEEPAAKQVAEKGPFPEESREKRTSGPEGLVDCMLLTPGINPRPTARMNFFASCKDGCSVWGDSVA